MSLCHRRRDSGFTLVELLVVIAIIGILVALLLPAIQAAREAARRAQCLSQLKQMGIALQSYHDVHKRFPMGRNGTEQENVSWAYYLLPQIEEQAMYDAHDPTVEAADPLNAKTMRSPVEVYVCPSRRAATADRNFDNNDSAPPVDWQGVASAGGYCSNAGHDALTDGTDGSSGDAYRKDIIGPVFTESEISIRYVTDGLSKTLAVGERHIPPIPQGTPANMEHYEVGDVAFIAGDNPSTIFCGTEDGLAEGVYDPDLQQFGGEHPGVVQFVFLDGHTYSMSKEVEVEVLMALSSIGGDELVGDL